MEQLGGKREKKSKKPDVDPNFCKFQVQSGHSSKLNLVWVNPSGGTMPMGEVNPEEITSLNSYNGHKFRLEDEKTGKKTNDIECQASVGLWKVNSALKVAPARGKPEL